MLRAARASRVRYAAAFRFRAAGPVVAAMAVLLAAGGCANPLVRDGSRDGPFFTPVNHVGVPSLTGIRRVVVLPIWSAELAPRETLMELDRVLLTALVEQNRFEAVTLSRHECQARFGVEALASTSALPSDFLARLRDAFGAEAVLFTDLTAFSAYNPMTIGLRAKLAPIDHPWLAWAFDEVFSTANPAVANGARRHVRRLEPVRLPGESLAVPLHSPSRFASYAAAAMFSTLPPVRPEAMLTPAVSH